MTTDSFEEALAHASPVQAPLTIQKTNNNKINEVKKRWRVSPVRLPDDWGTEEALEVTAAREAKARDDLFCDGGASDDVTPLEDGDGEAGAGEVGGGGEAVVAAADD